MLKKRLLFSIGFIFIISVIIYVIGRCLFPQWMTDDRGDYFLGISVISFVLILPIYLSNYKIVKRTLKLNPITNVFIGIFIISFLAFGVWGMYTKQGQKQFDEMDAIYPFFALVCAGILAVSFIFLNIFQFSKKKKG